MKEINLYDLPSNINSSNTCFICCASFETRCLSIPLSLVEKTFDRFIIFKTQDELGETNNNIKTIFDKYSKSKTNIEIKDLSTIDPLFSFTSFCSVISDLSDNINLIIDVTTFTRESLLILIRVIHKFKEKIVTLKFLYTPSIKMDSWLSRGISEFRSVLGFAGMFTPKKSLHLIILTGFELERAIATIDEYEPSIISIGVGDKNASVRPEFHQKNISFVDELVNIYGNVVNQFTFSLLDPIICKESIINHINTSQDANIVIAPLSNKISTIGAGLVGLEYKNVQLCYAKPKEYNIQDYSTADNKCFLIDMKL